MYLSKDLLLAAYAKLSTLSEDPTQQGATQRVSAIRYFLAMDSFAKRTGKDACDTGVFADKHLFNRCVSEIVALSSSEYTPAFYSLLKKHSGDCGTGSNFYSAGQVYISQTTTKPCIYPKRSGWLPLLIASEGRISIYHEGDDNGYRNLPSYITEECQRVALFIWIARTWDVFNSEDTISSDLGKGVSKYYSNFLLESIFPSDSAIEEFVNSVNSKLDLKIAHISEVDINMLFKRKNRMNEIACILPHQLIIYGAPGTGKSWRINRDTEGCEVVRTTFHPDSDYSTFVGAYKPTMSEDAGCIEVYKGNSGSRVLDATHEIKKGISYKFVAQAFAKAYVNAWKTLVSAAPNSEPARQYLVIEEINRGNCAQIFGDLFQLLDRNDEGFSDYEIVADDDLRQYLAEAFKDLKASDAADCVPVGVAAKLECILRGEILLLPSNLYIWATMNTSDQSLFPIDSAFKRRWEWRYVPISDGGKGWKIRVTDPENADVTYDYDWWTFLEKANDLVQKFTDSEDKKLGYYFCKANAEGVILLAQFVGKVVFYLWNSVFKDADADDAAFKNGKGGFLRFSDFFDAKGDPNVESVRQFLQNLEVPEIAKN